VPRLLGAHEHAFEERDGYLKLLLGLISIGRRLSRPASSGDSCSVDPALPGQQQTRLLALGLISVGRCLERLMLVGTPESPSLGGPDVRKASPDLDPCSADRPAGAQGHPGSLMALARRASAHRGSAAVMIPSLHKEWLHFCVIDGDVEALVNLSVMPRRQAAIGRPQLEGRVVLMVRMAGQWWGGVDHFDASAVAARPGQPGLAVGGSHVRFETDCIRVQAGLESGDVSVDLTLVPLTVPVLRRPFVRGAVGWGVVPRLMATGEVRTRNTTRTIAGPWAYHDHNWGVFRWGDEFLWQWGMALPTGPGPAWTTVFTRLLDNGRLTESGRALLLWRDQDLVRVFRDLSVSYDSHDLRRCRSIPKFPPIMRLLAPELDTDIRPACR
jgi:hypothetical protein